MNNIIEGKEKKKLANYVLQFVFLGYTGFRFPVAHFGTNSADASELNTNFWKGVKYLHEYGFKVKYTNMDGEQQQIGPF